MVVTLAARPSCKTERASSAARACLGLPTSLTVRDALSSHRSTAAASGGRFRVRDGISDASASVMASRGWVRQRVHVDVVEAELEPGAFLRLVVIESGRPDGSSLFKEVSP